MSLCVLRPEGGIAVGQQKAKRRVGLSSWLGRLFLLFMGGSLVCNLIFNQVQISAKKQILADLQTQLVQQQAANDELKRILENDTDDEIIERVARDQFGYARPSERVFYDMSGK